MPFRLMQAKDLSLFPPFLCEGDNLFSKFRRFYLAQSEILASLCGMFIFLNFIIFCGKQDQADLRFRIINSIISFILALDVAAKYTLIKCLYLNSYYYGNAFIILDIISGPLSFLFNCYNLLQTHQELTITVADIFLLLKIFTLEKIRLLIKDVYYILYVSRYINYALLLCYYMYCYVAYTIFQVVSPKYFRNPYKSMLSMFQVLTLDSWNLQVNQSVSGKLGQMWSIFFLFFILFMFFYFINLLLGAFVSYYSNPNLRRNFEYDFAHDDILNRELNLEFKQSIDIKQALKILDLDQTPFEQARLNWGLNEAELSIYIYILFQNIFQIFLIFNNENSTLKLGLVTMESMLGLYFCLQFVFKSIQFFQFRKQLQNIALEDKSSEEIAFQEEEYAVRLFVVVILFMCGPLATLADIITIIFNFDSLTLRFGPGLRTLSILAILYVQRLVFKFVKVLPGVSHIIIFVGGILFTMALIGHQFLKDTDVGYPLFNSLTNTYMFMLQVVTFDSWGDIARIVIKQNGVIYVLYFLFLTIFVGFFLMNMLVGVMATMTQPKTQELFEKDHIMKQRVNKKQVEHLNEQIQKYQKVEQLNEQQKQLKEILDDFNSSKSNERLFVVVDGIKYEITTKNFLQFNEDQ